ncbi:MAG: FxDxF family PEP-CTERM protein [Burkholderiaceae bacterium]
MDTNWGVVPVESGQSYTFASYDTKGNFADQYSFTVAGTQDMYATFSLTVSYDVCNNGCGNPETSYGIYQANGGLVTMVSGTGETVLAAGDYVFKAAGTGMGGGNTTSYGGSLTVAPVPEPSEWALMAVGSTFLLWAVRRRRARMAWPALAV